MSGKDKEMLGKKIRAAERGLAKKLIRWSMQRKGRPLPPEEVMDRASGEVVEEAHRVLGRAGKNILAELKETKEAFKKAYHEDDEDH